MNAPLKAEATYAERPETTVFAILAATSVCHCLNDTMQSLLPALYPVLKSTFALSFAQVGLLTFVFQITASLLQPIVGQVTDRYPQPYSLPAGMAFTFSGLILLSVADTYPLLLLSAALIGCGSAVFHPESSRIARMASGGRHGFAQSFFQVGGNVGFAIGPLLAAFIVVPRGQSSIGWFSLLALTAMLILWRVSAWYKAERARIARRPPKPVVHRFAGLSRKKVVTAIFILAALVFSKHFYLAGLGSYYTFYLIEKFHVSVQSAQLHLFLFLVASAIGTLVGGPIGDRVGRKAVIWVSILGVLPFTVALPYADIFFTGVLTVIIGLVISSAFSAIVVFAHELVPTRIGMISGLFFGLAFGIGGLGAAVLGVLADATSVEFVFKVCAFLPAIGLITWFLPDTSKARVAVAAA